MMAIAVLCQASADDSRGRIEKRAIKTKFCESRRDSLTRWDLQYGIFWRYRHKMDVRPWRHTTHICSDRYICCGICSGKLSKGHSDQGQGCRETAICASGGLLAPCEVPEAVTPYAQRFIAEAYKHARPIGAGTALLEMDNFSGEMS